MSDDLFSSAGVKLVETAAVKDTILPGSPEWWQLNSWTAALFFESDRQRAQEAKDARPPHAFAPHPGATLPSEAAFRNFTKPPAQIADEMLVNSAGELTYLQEWLRGPKQQPLPNMPAVQPSVSAPKPAAREHVPYLSGRSMLPGEVTGRFAPLIAPGQEPDPRRHRGKRKAASETAPAPPSLDTVAPPRRHEWWNREDD